MAPATPVRDKLRAWNKEMDGTQAPLEGRVAYLSDSEAASLVFVEMTEVLAQHQLYKTAQAVGDPWLVAGSITVYGTALAPLKWKHTNGPTVDWRLPRALN